MERKHVLVVDDSAVVRQAFSMLLSRVFTVDTAADPLIASRRIERRRPDVIVLDLQMPRMDGLTFLRQIMRTDPIPVVICSVAAARGSETAMRALEEGGVDVIAKPAIGVREFLAESALMLVDTIAAACHARVGRPRPRLSPPQFPSAGTAPVDTRASAVVAIGASTGGTEALRVVLESLPRDAPPVVVVQHMPPGFTTAFAKRLNETTAMEVKEAVSGDAVIPGRVLLAPGNRHLALCRSGASTFVQVFEGELVSRHRPSVDVLFRSVARTAGANALGILLTGMGDDGAAGLLELRNAGASTVAQDESTSVVFGMPKEAIKRGAAGQILPLHEIAAAILRHTALLSSRASARDPGVWWREE
jgi:two-component system chemotaxis response regulator CheB